jgi:ABC-type bacteriocin/lantibiotic exporter with double-glycine peptidase domain
MSEGRVRMLHTTGWLFCLAAMLPGCMTVEQRLGGTDRDPSPRALYIQEVPFYPQRQYECGPASLAAVMNFWGYRVTPEQIGEQIDRPKLTGTLSIDMWQYARAQHFLASIHQGSWEFLETQMSRQRPVIAFLNLGFQQIPIGHFLVVVGLDPGERSVIVYSAGNMNLHVPYDRFKGAWEKTNYWALLVEPEAEEPNTEPTEAIARIASPNQRAANN